MELISKYFPDLTTWQIQRFEMLLEIVPRLNQQVNVISRKDIAHLEERHILHSLSIGKKFRFDRSTSVVDAGTGGGFPGIPLAILFPETAFTLVDSIGKKINLVRAITHALQLKNVSLLNERIEHVDLKADFVVSRAVTAFPLLYRWTRKIIVPGHQNSMPNGLISLKGGDLGKELSGLRETVLQFPLSTWFDEPFFYSKMIVYLKK